MDQLIAQLAGAAWTDVLPHISALGFEGGHVLAEGGMIDDLPGKIESTKEKTLVIASALILFFAAIGVVWGIFKLLYKAFNSDGARYGWMNPIITFLLSGVVLAGSIAWFMSLSKSAGNFITE